MKESDRHTHRVRIACIFALLSGIALLAGCCFCIGFPPGTPGGCPTCPPSGSDGVMYVANNTGRSVTRASLAGTFGAASTLDGTLNYPSGIALNASAGEMFVADAFAGIVKANLDGTEVETLPVSGLSNPEGIALDTVAGKLYVTNRGRGEVIVANLDGSDKTAIDVSDLISHPYGIALDVGAGKMYVSSAGNAALAVFNLDGTGGELLAWSSQYDSRGIALDLAAGKMYVTDLLYNSVVVANLDGSNEKVLDLGGLLDEPWGIALDVAEAKMYVTNTKSSTVVVANLDGTSAEVLHIATLSSPMGIAILP